MGTAGRGGSNRSLRVESFADVVPAVVPVPQAHRAVLPRLWHDTGDPSPAPRPPPDRAALQCAVHAGSAVRGCLRNLALGSAAGATDGVETGLRMAVAECSCRICRRSKHSSLPLHVTRTLKGKTSCTRSSEQTVKCTAP